MSTVKVFCYGSNMSSERLKDRCEHAQFISKASLPGYQFKFNKKSTDGSGKANIIKTGSENDVVWGVVYEIPEVERKSLNRAEGIGYEKMILPIIKENGESEKTLVYIAIKSKYLDPSLKPTSKYKKYCTDGAKEFKLPLTYLKSLEDFEALE